MHKLSLAGDDNANLKIFTRKLPIVFGSSLRTNITTVKVSVRSSLPALPTYKIWEDLMSKKGLRDIIKKNMRNVKALIKTNIFNRLGSLRTNITAVKVSVRSSLPALPTYKIWEDLMSKKDQSHKK